ncbi:hypothetical protein B7469_09460 [Staphylococcus lugdunensis]|nr:hypothetical protein B7469_09460 [Staphylococcus lugdunensis]
MGDSFSHPNLLCLVNFFSKFSLLGPPHQLALIDEMLFAFLFVGAPVFSLSCSLKSLAKIRRIYM